MTRLRDYEIKQESESKNRPCGPGSKNVKGLFDNYREVKRIRFAANFGITRQADAAYNKKILSLAGSATSPKAMSF